MTLQSFNVAIQAIWGSVEAHRWQVVPWVEAFESDGASELRNARKFLGSNGFKQNNNVGRVVALCFVPCMPPCRAHRWATRSRVLCHSHPVRGDRVLTVWDSVFRGPCWDGLLVGWMEEWGGVGWLYYCNRITITGNWRTSGTIAIRHGWMDVVGLNGRVGKMTVGVPCCCVTRVELLDV